MNRLVETNLDYRRCKPAANLLITDRVLCRNWLQVRNIPHFQWGGLVIIRQTFIKSVVMNPKKILSVLIVAAFPVLGVAADALAPNAEQQFATLREIAQKAVLNNPEVVAK